MYHVARLWTNFDMSALSLLGNMYEMILTEEVEDRRPAEVFREYARKRQCNHRAYVASGGSKTRQVTALQWRRPPSPHLVHAGVRDALQKQADVV